MTEIIMAKHANVAQQRADVLQNTVETVLSEKTAIEDMPLETLRDYRLYNEEARKANKKLRILRYPIKQCPVELHPHTRVKVARNDGTTNDIPVFLSNDKIHFEKTIKHNEILDLPDCVVSYLSDKGTSVWGWVDLDKNGSRETRIVGKKNRFSITTVYAEAY
jgi:hypothetical protein